MQHSHQSYPAYSSMTDGVGGTGQTSTSPLGLTSNGSGSHYYHRVGIGVPQQSPVFNSLMPGQGQSLYNGVYNTQTSFANQNNFSTATFNSCIETPVWFSDARVSLPPSNNMSHVTENDVISRNQYIDKNLSCCGTRIGVLENIGMCSPLSESFKMSNKDFSNLTPKNASLIDSPNWLCNQGMSGFTNQQNVQHPSQQSNFKCNEQFSSCSVSQINVLLSEQNELKLASNVSVDNSCFLSMTQNQANGGSNNSNKNNINHSDSNQDKSGYSNREHVLTSKYSCSLQKQESGQTSILSPGHSKTAHDPNNYSSISTMYTSTNTDSNVHEYVIYSQAPFIPNVNDTVESTRKPLLLPVSVLSPHQNSITGQLPVFQQHFHDATITCDSSTADNCFQVDSKGVKNNENPGIQNINALNNRSCCNISTGCDQHTFTASCPYTPRESAHCISESALLPSALQHNLNDRIQHACDHKVSIDQTCKNVIPNIKLDCSNSSSSGYKENGNEGSSIAGESDIIVEETEDETESEISIDENKLDNSVKCLVCNTLAISQNNNMLSNKFIRISTAMSTTTSDTSVLKKITQILPSDITLFNQDIVPNGYICKICLNITDNIDKLETQLMSLKQDLTRRYHQRELAISVGDSVNKPPNCAPLETETTPLVNLRSDPITGTHVEDVNHNAHVNQSLTIQSTCKSHITDVNIIEDISPHIHIKMCREKHQCSICAKGFASKIYLDKHQQTHTKEYSFYCEHCGQGFMLKRILDNHLLVHKGEFKYQCEICGKLFIQKFNLNIHLRKHNNDYSVTCAHCGKGFMTRTSLKIHLSTHSQEKPFVCQHCGRTFGTNSNLVAHIRVCSGDSTFFCDRCEKRCSSKSQLRKHISSSHEGNYSCKCNVCGRGFMKNSDLKAHMVTHTLEKKYKCSVCEKSYTSLGNLNQHAKKHDKERPFKCTLCSQGFLRRSAFTNHINKHAGTTPFSCDQCSKTFTSTRNLQAHLKWHAGTLKKYVCTICGKTLRHGLKVHMRTHLGQPYKCSKCDMTFTVKSTLHKHLKLKHDCIGL